MTARIALRITGLTGALAVALGAFGAHALRDHVEASLLGTWRTASLYHLVHVVALGLCAALLQLREDRAARGGMAHDSARRAGHAAVAFLVGIAVFSGSLYALVLSGQRWLGAITPVGGLAFIVGWLLLAASAAPGGRAGPAGRD